jgi:DNA-binding NarL/FixJ family response regulator
LNAPLLGVVHNISSVRILLVDDHDLFRAGLRSLLEEEGFEVADADGGEAALRRARAQAPDVVLMDINMPGMSGIEATRQLQGIAPGVPIVMLTVASDDEHVLDAVRAGASGYLLKDAELDEIAAAVRAAAAGQAAIAPGIAPSLLARIRETSTHRPDPETPPRPQVELSERERQVLELLTAGAENAEIAAKLFVGEATVKTHVARVLMKLGVRDRVQAVIVAFRAGLVRPTSPAG